MDSTTDDRDDDIGDRQAYELYGWELPPRQDTHAVSDLADVPESAHSDQLPRQYPTRSWESIASGTFPGFTPASHRERTPSPSGPVEPPPGGPVEPPPHGLLEPPLNEPSPTLAPSWHTIIPVIPGGSPEVSGPQPSPEWRTYPAPWHGVPSPHGHAIHDHVRHDDVPHHDVPGHDVPGHDGSRDERWAWGSTRSDDGLSRSPLESGEDERLERAGIKPLSGHTEPASDQDADRSGADQSSADRSGRDRRSMPLWQELPLLLVIAFCMAVLIRTFLVQAFYIPSGSMEETLLVGDRVLVNKIVYDVRQPERGEVVVFRGTDNWAPENFDEPSGGLSARVGRTLGDLVGMSRPGEKDFIKRVIGLPGDRVSCCDPSGRVYVNGKGLDEPYVLDNSPEDIPPDPRVCRSRQFEEVLVPPGQLFVMGDHRIVSQDSRCQGTVPIENVIGRAFVIVWPSGRWDTLTVPETFASVP
jgi:signal peptidase I